MRLEAIRAASFFVVPEAVEIVAIADEAWHAEEQGARARLVAAIAESADVGIGACQAPTIDSGEEVG